MVKVGRDGVARPDDDELRMHEAFGIDAARRADGQKPCGGRSRRAERLFVHGGAEAIEEGVAGVDALHEAHVAEIAVGHDGLAAVFGDDLAPAAADFGDRFFPGDALPLAGTLWTFAAERIEQAIGIGVVVVEVLELHAETTARHRDGPCCRAHRRVCRRGLRRPSSRCRGSRAGTRRGTPRTSTARSLRFLSRSLLCALGDARLPCRIEADRSSKGASLWH